MAVCEMHFTSASLQKMVSAAIITPEGMPGPWPVLYLLHGLSDDHTGWVRRTSIERYVRDLPLMVVMPDGGRSWYTDSATNPTAAYETFMVRDLIEFIDGTFNTKPTREDRVIAGLSMGGYGSFKLALKHPDLFRAAASLSGAFHFGPVIAGADDRAREMSLIFGGDFTSGSDDVLALLDRADRSAMPALWMHCGVDDFLIQSNRDLHAHMNSLGIAHQYHEAPGGHSWDYWDTHIVEALEFLSPRLPG